MKSLINWLLAIVILVSINMQAQIKKFDPNAAKIVTPKKNVTIMRPDLTFDIQSPNLINEAKGFEHVEGVVGSIKVLINLGVQNIGLVDSRPCQVVARLLYQGPRTSFEINHGVQNDGYNSSVVSRPMELQAVKKGETVIRLNNFTFNQIPEEAWGKRVKVQLEILYNPSNGEISTQNNISSKVVEFDLIK